MTDALYDDLRRPNDSPEDFAALHLWNHAQALASLYGIDAFELVLRGLGGGPPVFGSRRRL